MVIDEVYEEPFLQLENETRAFVERRIKELGLHKPGAQLKVSVDLAWDVVPPVVVRVGLQPHKKRVTIDRPLTEEDWELLSGLPFSESLRGVFDFFWKSGNSGTKGTVLIAEGVLSNTGSPMNQFNVFLQKHGQGFAIRKIGKERGPWENSSYRIVPVE